MLEVNSKTFLLFMNRTTQSDVPAVWGGKKKVHKHKRQSDASIVRRGGSYMSACDCLPYLEYPEDRSFHARLSRFPRALALQHNRQHLHQTEMKKQFHSVNYEI